MEGDGVGNRRPSFFAIMPADCAMQLVLPLGFPQKVKLPESLVLISSDIKNKSWTINITVKGVYHYFTGPGWTAFAADHKLVPEEMVLFKFLNESTVRASVYFWHGVPKWFGHPSPDTSNDCNGSGKNGVEEVIDSDTDSDPDWPEVGEDIEVDDEEEGIDEDDDEDYDEFVDEDTPIDDDRCYWEVTIKRNQMSTITVPVEFERKANLRSAPEASIFDADGKEWVVLIKKIPRRNSYYFSTGWSSFLKDNNFKDGDKLELETIPGIHNQVLATKLT